MRLLHTSDWHLGRRLCDVSLLEDQAHVLEQIFYLCKDVDALVIAGDLYDRAIPPEEAVCLLSEFLQRVVKDLRIPVIAISGNHDSQERLGFGAGLLEVSGVHLRTSLSRRAEPIVVKDVPIYCLPFMDPVFARTELGAEVGNDELTTHHRVTAAALASMNAHRAGRDAVLVGHLFARGAVESPDSERPLVVGGAGHVDVKLFSGWSYVALGHLHQPQAVTDAIRYSGSLLKYSFGEQAKSVSVVEVGGVIEQVPLSPRRDLLRIEATFDELLTDARFSVAEGAYVEATYTDTTYLIDVARRLRARFPHLLGVVPRAIALPEPTFAIEAAVRGGRELLADFWKHVSGTEIPNETVGELFERSLEETSRPTARPVKVEERVEETAA